MKEVVLFAHAVSGGDRTSAIFNQGKSKPYSSLEKNYTLREKVAKTINSKDSSPDQIADVVEEFVKELYPDGH